MTMAWPGKGGKMSLLIDGKKVGEGRVGVTVAMAFSGDETCDVGKETGSPMSTGLRSERQRVHRRGQPGPDRLN